MTTITILHARSRQHHWQGIGLLSLKTFCGGHADYTVAGARHRVDERGYLLLNEGQEYTIQVEAATPVESFCVFFAPGLAESSYAGLHTPTERLLDDPTPAVTAALCFYERIYPHDPLLSAALTRLQQAATEPAVDRGRLEEEGHGLLQRLLVIHRKTSAEVVALPYLRAATREELYRRLYRARDTMIAQLDQPLTLADMAQQAALSPNHFLRTFKQLFHQSPHQFLLQQRLQRAAHLLIHSSQSVTEIALAVGFASLGTFSWRFRQHFGEAPTLYRQAKR
jgi:AraC-like DNA-binding protein